MAENRQYDPEYKVQYNVFFGIPSSLAAFACPISFASLTACRVRANRLGTLDLGAGSQTPGSAMTLNEELIHLRQQIKELDKENRRQKKENDFLEEASAFFAASRLRSAKTKE